MSNYNTLISAIQSYIKQNGNNEITGQILQSQLISMISELGFGYQYRGIAFPSTSPGTPDARVFYVAYTPGVYTNFNGLTVTGFCILKYDTTWRRDDIPIGGGGEDFSVEPDDLTLETVGQTRLLKFANREYDTTTPNGYGYKILRTGDVLATEMAGLVNTVFSIRYDFDLNGATLALPENSILRFDGGALKNGTLTGNKTTIEAGDYQIFDGITFGGTFVGELNARWVGAKSGDSSFDNAAIIQSWFTSYCATFRVLSFPTGTYYFLSEASLTTDKRNLILDGNGSLFDVNIPTDDAYFIKIQTGGSSSGENFRIQNVRIVNVKQTSGYSISKTRGILFDGTQRFAVSNVQIWQFDIAIELVNVWYGGFYGQNILRSNRIGLFIHTANNFTEVNTIEIHNVDFNGVSRATVASIYPQEEGESNDDYLTRTACCGIDAYCLLQAVGIRGSVFEGSDYGIRTNWWKRSSNATSTGGPVTIDGCYFEANRVEDIFIGRGNETLFGTGSNNHFFIHEISISNCRFFTLKHAFLMGVKAFIYSNQDFSIAINSNNQVSSVVDCQGPVTIDGLVGNNASVHKIGGRSYNMRAYDGTTSVPSPNFGKLQQTRYYGNIISRLNGYSKTSNTGYDNNVQFKTWNFETEPKVKYGIDILPLEFYYDIANSYGKVLVPSGNGLLPVAVNVDRQFRALNSYGGISLYEFVRRWKAGITYTGTVKYLFPFEITADPEAGTVVNANGTLVGFGTNALGTTITTSYTTGTYFFVDALIWVRISYSRIKQYFDHLQNARSYEELRGNIDQSSINYLSCYGSNANMANAQKRINAVYWDTTNKVLMIYNGFEWVEMTSAFQRYYYKAYGLKLSERATMADMPGQTFTNYATGITYTFIFRANNNFKWVPSIGMVDDLAHPNGYSDDNTLDYANELSIGEMVMYNGALYKWDGTQLVTV